MADESPTARGSGRLHATLTILGALYLIAASGVIIPMARLPRALFVATGFFLAAVNLNAWVVLVAQERVRRRWRQRRREIQEAHDRFVTECQEHDAVTTKNSKARNWLFLQFPVTSGFGLVRRDDWADANHLDNPGIVAELRADGVDMTGFSESTESWFVYNPDPDGRAVDPREQPELAAAHYQAGLARLRELGFEEIDNPFDDSFD